MSVNGDSSQQQPGVGQTQGGVAASGNTYGQPPVHVVPPRPWLAPAIACAIAAAVLLFLLVPGVLQYPVQQAPVLVQPYAPDPAAQRATNSALSERIASLRRLIDAQVCVAPEGYRLPEGPAASQVRPEDRAALPPALPDQTAVPPQSLPEGQPFAGSLLDLLDQATFLVLQTDAKGDVQGSGTGFLVAPGRVLTNRHVTEGPAGRKIFLAGRGVGVVNAEILAESANGEPGAPDFALLGLPAGSGQTAPLPLSFAPTAERLTNVVSAGYPGLVMDTDERFQRLVNGDRSNPDNLPTASVTEGVITAIQAGDGTSMVLHTAQITPGNSGGPLVDRCGRVIGINTFIQTREEGRMNYALAATDAGRFLAANGVTVRTAENGCTPAALTAPATPPAATPPAGTAPAETTPAAPAATPAQE